MFVCHDPRASRVLGLWWMVFVLATMNEISMVGGFIVLRCTFPAESSAPADGCPSGMLLSTTNDHDETTDLIIKTTICSQQEPQTGMAKKSNAGWIQRMTNYLSSEKDDIFAGNHIVRYNSSGF